jgi:hypothetical protein
MDIVIIVAIAAGVIGIIIGVSVYTARMQRLRREAIERFAADSGLTFSAEDVEKTRARLVDFQLFKEGRGQRAYNLVRAEAEGVRMSVFDYQFTTGSGKSQHTYRQTVLAVESNGLHLPPLSIRPENLFDALAGILGFRDIDFEDHPEFSRGFVLKSPDEERTRKLFDDEMFQFFTQRRDVALEANRNRFVYYRRNRIVPPAEIKNFLADGLQLFNLFLARLVRMEEAEKIERRR